MSATRWTSLSGLFPVVLAAAVCSGACDEPRQAPAVSPASAATPVGTYDVVIANGRVVDGTGAPARTGAVRIDGELYWDGGILSNTPTERIFDDHPRRNSLIFAVHLWNPTGDEPTTIWEILNRHKDIQYSSRIASHIVRQREAHKLRHVITKLMEYVPEKEKQDPLYRELAQYHCETRMHVVRLLAPRLDNENHTKDIDFSPAGIRARWDAGYADTNRALERKAWLGEFGLLDGVILHEPEPGSEPAAEIQPGEPGGDSNPMPPKLAAE